MPSKTRKQELFSLLGNCVIAIALLDGSSDRLKLAQDAATQHISELNRDYPGWQRELQSGNQLS